MDINERFEKFFEYKGIKRSEFERKCGLSNGYTRNLRDSPKSEKMKDILKNFPEINPIWLQTGEGEMLKPSVQQTSQGKNSPNVYGDNNHFEGCASIDRAFATLDTSLAQNAAVLKTLDTALAEIAEQRKLVAQSMAQTAMLIQLIQNQNNNN